MALWSRKHLLLWFWNLPYPWHKVNIVLAFSWSHFELKDNWYHRHWHGGTSRPTKVFLCDFWCFHCCPHPLGQSRELSDCQLSPHLLKPSIWEGPGTSICYNFNRISGNRLHLSHALQFPSVSCTGKTLTRSQLRQQENLRMQLTASLYSPVWQRRKQRGWIILRPVQPTSYLLLDWS